MLVWLGQNSDSTTMSIIYQVLFVLCLAVGHAAIHPSMENCKLMEPEVQDALREDLLKNNCLQEVEIVEPIDVLRAKRLFYRDGYVVVRDILNEEQIAPVKDASNRMAQSILDRDPKRIGNRGPKRYSFGTLHKTGHILHYPEIAKLVDNPAINDVLTAIFGNDKYIVRGARGDFNLPGAPYQPVHSDISPLFLEDPAETEFPDSGRIDFRDLPAFYVVVNYILADLNALNAPIRQIPMTQHLHRPMPSIDDEPLWMKRSTLCPVPAGSVIIRDPRAWHGGTPNLSDGIRLMPNIEYYAYWFRYHGGGQMTKSMPREIYDTLSPRGQELCREVVAPPGEEIDTSMVDNLTMRYEDVLPCYYKMGLTEEEMEAAPLYDARKFYGNKDATASPPRKDEL